MIKTVPGHLRLIALGAVTASALVWAFVPTPAGAAAEDMDQSFGAAGLVPTGVGTEGRDVAIDSEGRILAAFSQSEGGNAGVIRLLPDGSFDSTFSGDGIARYPGVANATRVAVDALDRPLFAGWTGTGSGTVAANVVRFTESGSLDDSFDGNGSRGLGNWVPTALQVGSNGRIVLALVPPLLASGAAGDSTVLQLTPSGAPDPSFDSDGVAAISFAFPGARSRSTEDLVIGSDGRITIAVSIDCCVRSGVVRLLVNGAADPSLNQGSPGQSGYAELPSSWAPGRAVAVDSAGRTLLAGTTRSTPGQEQRTFVGRLGPDGRADATFGTAGLVIANLGIGADYPLDVMVAPDGKPVVAGESSATDIPYSFLLGRFTSAGAADTSFSQDGNASAQIGLGMRAAIDGAGRVVMVGWGDGTPTLGPRNLLVARYLKDGALATPPDSSPGDGGAGSVAGGVATSARNVHVHRIHVPGSRKKLARVGVRVLASCDEGCRIVVELRVSQRIANAMGLAGTLLARGSVSAAAGERRWVLARPTGATRRALRSYKGSGRLQVDVTGVVR